MSSSASAACAAFPSGSSGGASTKVNTNTKSRNPVAKAKARSDPVGVALKWRRKTLKDYNKVCHLLPAAQEFAEKTLKEAHHFFGCVSSQCQIDILFQRERIRTLF